MRAIMFGGALALIAVTAFAAEGAAVAQATKGVTQRDLSIAGAKTGMTPTQVLAVLVKGGYRLVERTHGLSWDAKVRAALEGLKAAPAKRDAIIGEDYARGEERVQVYYAQTPVGASVASLTYSIPTGAIATEAFRAQLISRCGHPQASGEGLLVFCASQESRCSAFWSNQFLSVYVTMSSFGDRTIKLSEGARTEQQRAALLRAEIERRSGRIKKPTF